MEEVLTMVGISELVAELETLAKQYPDKAGELLQKQGRELRKEVIKNVKKSTKTAGSKKSLRKVGSYRVSRPKGTGIRQYVEVSAQSPHFHLVEHGHELVVNGENRGFVPGKHMMADAVKAYEREMPTATGRMLDALLKERGLS